MNQFAQLSQICLDQGNGSQNITGKMSPVCCRPWQAHERRNQPQLEPTEPSNKPIAALFDK